jgi:hypothetical protein
MVPLRTTYESVNAELIADFSDPPDHLVGPDFGATPFTHDFDLT